MTFLWDLKKVFRRPRTGGLQRAGIGFCKCCPRRNPSKNRFNGCAWTDYWVRIRQLMLRPAPLFLSRREACKTSF
jgi:hypothetical protein